MLEVVHDKDDGNGQGPRAAWAAVRPGSDQPRARCVPGGASARAAQPLGSRFREGDRGGSSERRSAGRHRHGPRHRFVPGRARCEDARLHRGIGARQGGRADPEGTGRRKGPGGRHGASRGERCPGPEGANRRDAQAGHDAPRPSRTGSTPSRSRQFEGRAGGREHRASRRRGLSATPPVRRNSTSLTHS